MEWLGKNYNFIQKISPPTFFYYIIVDNSKLNKNLQMFHNYKFKKVINEAYLLHIFKLRFGERRFITSSEIPDNCYVWFNFPRIIWNTYCIFSSNFFTRFRNTVVQYEQHLPKSRSNESSYSSACWITIASDPFRRYTKDFFAKRSLFGHFI